MKTKFIEILRRELENSGLSQRQFGAKCGLSNGAICHYLKGERSPTAEIVLQIACKLNVTTDYLLTGTNYAPDYKEPNDSDGNGENPLEYKLL